VSEDVLQLIVIDDSSNDAETISNMLRNAGTPVRTERVEDDEDLRAQLGAHPWDMILTKPGITYLNATEAIAVVRQLGQDIPLIVIADGADEDNILALLKAGARDSVHLSEPVQLHHTLLREYGDLQLRRRYRECSAMLELASTRAQALVNASRDAIAYVHDGMHIYANESYLNMFGYSALEEIEGMPIMNMVKNTEHGKFKEFLRDYSKGKSGKGSFDVNGLRADGSDFKITMEFSHTAYDSEPCTQIVIRDQSSSKELEKKLDDMSKLDLLTGVYNRQYLLDTLTASVGVTGKKGALLYIRPENYKQIREEVGIAAADQIMVEMANRLKPVFANGKNLLGRFDSSIFMAVINNAEEAEALAAAGKLLQLIEDQVYHIAGKSLTLTCGIGIALFSDANKEPQEIITRAEKAHGQALKESGTRSKVYSPDAGEMAEREMLALWDKRLKQALRDSRFKLLYQPIVSLQGAPDHNYEVLLRMLGDNNEEILPSEFFPIAEQTGLMAVVDRWVLANGMKILMDQRRGGKPLRLYIKVSGSTVKDPKFLPWLRDLLKASHYDANALLLEISETVATNNLKTLKVMAEGLRQLQVGLVLDHFGVVPNYANLIKHCDFDLLKLDAGIIGTLASSKESQDKVKAITSETRELHKQTIASGVENAQTLAAIYSSGVDYIQGFFMQPPGPAFDYDFGSME
jgi:diguanylate cyclase (GGDEF)-like protein/PAS domain S-box-containing protein